MATTLVVYMLGGRGEEERKARGEAGGGRPRPSGFAMYLHFQIYLIAINL